MSLGLLKYLDGKWEDVRGFLRDDLDHIEIAFNNLDSSGSAGGTNVFNVTNVTNVVAGGTAASGGTPPGPDGEEGEQGVPGPRGLTGLQGISGPPGQDGADGESDIFGFVAAPPTTSNYVPYTGATLNVDLGAKTLTTTGAVGTGPLTAASPAIVHTNGAAQRLDIGATGDTASTSQIRFFADSTRTNWQVGNGIQVNSTLTFTPSTATDGTTFSAPVFQLALTGVTSLQPHTVSYAGGALLSLNDSAADAGVTNAAYMTFQTAGTTRYYVGISTSAANGNWEIYDNVAAGLAFSIIKGTGVVTAHTGLNVTGHAITTSVRGTAVTVANLPTTPVEGMLVAVTDSTTAVWGAIITGTGANHVLAYYNGTNWTVAGK